MAHHLQLFVGHPEVLRRYVDLSPRVQLYRLTPAAELAVALIDDEIQDALHKIYGTGEWLDALRLTTSDMAFAAETSLRGPLAYLETDYAAGEGRQAAATWAGGALSLRPVAMAVDQGLGRPAATWPINGALRALGVIAQPGRDAFETFGLDLYRTFEDVTSGALPVRMGR